MHTETLFTITIITIALTMHTYIQTRLQHYQSQILTIETPAITAKGR